MAVRNNKKAQLTIFIILGVLIVLIVILLVFNQGSSIRTIIGGKSPVEEIQDCVRDSAEEAIDLMVVQGGSLEPQNYYLYQGNKVDYLCYSNEDYKTCAVQKPLLKQSFEGELEKYLQQVSNNCLNSAKKSLEGKGYSVSFKQPEVSVQFVPNNIFIDIKSDLVLKKEQTETYETIRVSKESKLYDLLMVASSITNWEARYGDSETLSYMMYYPSLKVEKKKQSDGTTIYILTEKNSLDKFMFASRSLVLPAGITGE